MEQLKKTSLYPLYAKYGAKVIDFGGWALPVQFQGIIEEHNCVRTQAGLFDVSHMGEITISGRDAFSFLQYLGTNDFSKLDVNQVMYTLFCYEDGGSIDDLLVYRLKEDEYMLVVNAANLEKDLEWIHQQQQALSWDITITDISSETALLAVQGPNSEAVLQSLTSFDLSQIKKFRFAENVELFGVSAFVVSRTGYTGEDGFEIYLSANEAPSLWEAIISEGESLQVAPIGLGARDTLRFEAKLPLYGQELSENISPLEAGLGFCVKLNKGEFIGRDALVRQKELGMSRKLVGFEMIDRGVARNGYSVYVDEHEVGAVTTGSYSPTLKKNIGLAFVTYEYSNIGQELYICIRNKKHKAVIVKTPFLHE